ncbi:MAG TPA: hypothetical protein PKN13_08570 [Accumulibacter sp.]|nr:hypothetical protein [Accumulibacter sp.]HMW16983.1 hypothetical protein [Accumulibacter sp.]HNC17235.1 hypothetical protein [Accumulibacter sp.]HND79759.1 hypothetical protein [Accumulibacter sp.]HNE13485.1 hypothetical protein [Accumulibacter sp.]
MINSLKFFLIDHPLFLIGSLITCIIATFLYIKALRYRLWNSQLEINRLQHLTEDSNQRELQRRQYCETIGHDLDPSCACRRCLTLQHDYELIGKENVAIGEELVNPNADPGALYLDSNFQPDPDYGVTYTVYAEETTFRCERCGKEKKTQERQ